MQQINRTIHDVEKRLDTKIVLLDTKMDGVEKRLDAKIVLLDAKMDGVEKRLDAKMDGVEKRLDAKMDGVEKRLDTKMESVEKRQDAKRRRRSTRLTSFRCLVALAALSRRCYAFRVSLQATTSSSSSAVSSRGGHVLTMKNRSCEIHAYLVHRPSCASSCVDASLISTYRVARSSGAA